MRYLKDFYEPKSVAHASSLSIFEGLTNLKTFICRYMYVEFNGKLLCHNYKAVWS